MEGLGMTLPVLMGVIFILLNQMKTFIIGKNYVTTM